MPLQFVTPLSYPTSSIEELVAALTKNRRELETFINSSMVRKESDGTIDLPAGSTLATVDLVDDTHDHAGGDGNQIDHGGLDGLTNDDHTQYAKLAGATFTGRLTLGNFLNLGTPVELTVATGAVTVTQTRHSIDTQNDDPTDDLHSINGGSVEDLLVLSSVTAARDTTLRDNSVAGGNIFLAGSVDFPLATPNDRITLVRKGDGWSEISRATN
jgi:hypothetical protein